MKQHIENVKQFMSKAEQEVKEKPEYLDTSTSMFRCGLIMEELNELIAALGLNMAIIKGDDDTAQVVLDDRGPEPCMVEIADALADIIVVTTGTALAHGIDLAPILDMVDASNLDKFRGDAHMRGDGKWIKPSDWKAPDIKAELERQGYGCKSTECCQGACKA